MPKDTGLGSNGTIFVKRIDMIRKTKNLSRQEIANKCGISLQAFTHWSHRGTIPAADIALRIAECLDVSVEWLVSGKTSSGLSQEEEQIIKDFKKIPPEAQHAVKILIASYM